MKILNPTVKILQIALIFAIITFSSTDLAYARGGCFASGTDILTASGSKHIEHLQLKDTIIGYNLKSHQAEEEKIGDIQVLTVPEYYLINSRIKVTGTHPFYVQNSTELSIVEVKNLKIGDRLLGENNSQIMVASIEYIKKPISVYNLLSVTPDHNFYAGGVLVHNKGGGGGGSGGGGGGGRYGASGSPFAINRQNLPHFLLSIAALLFVLIPFGFGREMYNYIRFFGKRFTEDLALIEFIEGMNLKFTNFYSTQYSQDNEVWEMILAEEEMDETIYQDSIAKSDLIDRVSKLFIRYQTDWTMKKFKNMYDYIRQPLYSEQSVIFTRDFGENFDIVYQPELIDVIPLLYKQESDRCFFRVQINAKMVNFELSPKGFVLSGENYARAFTEYWDIELDSDRNCHLVNIGQIDR
jgi:hypothetical protein